MSCKAGDWSDAGGRRNGPWLRGFLPSQLSSLTCAVNPRVTKAIKMATVGLRFGIVRSVPNSRLMGLRFMQVYRNTPFLRTILHRAKP